MTNPYTCCEEPTGTSRRGFLRGSLALGGAAALTVAHGSAFTQTSYAATGVADQVLVVLSMRGACDGLSLVVPHADPVYYSARPRIAVPSDQLLVKDGFFGLHPALAPLVPLWNAGRMAAVHATGLPAPNRSHFSAMEELEDADPGSGARIGWLNRLVGRDGAGSPLEALQIGGGVPSAAVSGPQPVLVAQSVDNIRLPGPSGAKETAARRQALQTAWGASSTDLSTGLRAALDVVDDFAAVHATSTTPANGAVYPDNDLADALKDSARTIRANVGAEIITVDHGSWDHHTNIGTTERGNIKSRTDELAGAVAAFFTDLGPLADKVTLVTISEFGRRVKENANQGLDHGHGNVMFVMGAGVRGGRYYGSWPGLANTTDADLLVTTDYRNVLSEVIVSRFDASPSEIFPGLTPRSVGVMSGV